MKTIKRLSIVTVVTLAGLSSCSKDNATDPLVVDNSFTEPSPLSTTTALADTKVATSDLPQAVLDYVATNYPNASIAKSEVEYNGNYEVKLDDGTELIFDPQGVFLGIDDETNDEFGDTDIAPATLPAAILDYLASNYAELTVVEASIENNGHYEVELSDGTELVFDGDGNFLGIGVDDNEDGDDDTDSDNDGTDNENGGDGDNQDGNQHEDGTVIDAATLPQAVKDYLATNYPNETIVEARSMTDGGYEVELSSGIEVEFDADGNFVKTEDGGTEDGN